MTALSSAPTSSASGDPKLSAGVGNAPAPVADSATSAFTFTACAPLRDFDGVFTTRPPTTPPPRALVGDSPAAVNELLGVVVGVARSFFGVVVADPLTLFLPRAVTTGWAPDETAAW